MLFASLAKVFSLKTSLVSAKNLDGLNLDVYLK